MHVRVDPTKCQGYGLCAESAPELFDLDEFGFAQARDGGEVPAGEERLAGEALRGCPAKAILSDE